MDGKSLCEGPRFCGKCGAPHALPTAAGLRCYMCYSIDVAAANPVPLPKSKECLVDLASIGVPGAAAMVSVVPIEPEHRKINEAIVVAMGWKPGRANVGRNFEQRRRLRRAPLLAAAWAARLHRSSWL
jgi:hypothetical protein